MEELKPGHCHKCGLLLSDNPHPEAGKPPHYLEVGCPKECIPCLMKSRHSWAKRAMAAEKELRDWEWLREHHNDLDGPILVCYDSDKHGSLEEAIEAARLAGREGCSGS